MSRSLIEFLSNIPTHLRIEPLILLADVWSQIKLEKWICDRQPDYQFTTFKLMHSSSGRKFRLDTGKYLFTQREVKDWLPGEVVNAPSLSVFRRHFGCVNSDNDEPLRAFICFFRCHHCDVFFPRTWCSWTLQNGAFCSTLP